MSSLDPRQPLREHGFRLVAMLAGTLLGFVIVILVATTVVGGRAHGLLPELLGGALVLAAVITVPSYVIGNAVGQRFLVAGRIEVAFRRPGQRRWRQGRIEASTGRLRLQPYLWQIRVPHGAAEDFEDVVMPDPGTGVRPPLRTIWSLNPQLRILTVETASGPLELGALPSRLRALDARLG